MSLVKVHVPAPRPKRRRLADEGRALVAKTEGSSEPMKPVGLARKTTCTRGVEHVAEVDAAELHGQTHQPTRSKTTGLTRSIASWLILAILLATSGKLSAWA